MNTSKALIITAAAICIYHAANAQEQSSTLKDRDGNTYTLRIMPDNKQWMTTNLNINTEGSYCYQDIAVNCNQYGRLYTWESAQKVCNMLGEGWRLPADEEWLQMAGQYGGVFGNSVDSGKTAYKALLFGGNAEFNALLGGGRTPEGGYARLQAHGFYWTATESDTANAWFYNFGKGSGKLFHQKDGEKPRAFSVRCIRDARALKK